MRRLFVEIDRLISKYTQKFYCEIGDRIVNKEGFPGFDGYFKNIDDKL